MDSVAAIADDSPDRWILSCPACKKSYAVGPDAKGRAHTLVRCGSCREVFWGVRWWQRVVSITQRRKQASPDPHLADAAIMAALSCATEHLRARPNCGRHELQVRLFEQAFWENDPVRGFTLLQSLFPELNLASPALPAAAAQAECQTVEPAVDSTVASPAFRIHIRCPSCDAVNAFSGCHAVGDTIATCPCGHSWAWSLLREMDGMSERLKSLSLQLAPILAGRLRRFLGPSSPPISALVRQKALRAAGKAEESEILDALRLLTVELA